MAYIGRDPLYGTFEKQVLVPNGTDTLFTLDYIAGSDNALLVVENGSVLEPSVDYGLAEGGRKIEFSTAPQNPFYIIYLGKQYLVPSFAKTFTVSSLSGNLTLNVNELSSVLSFEPLTTNRTVNLPDPAIAGGYELVIRNRSTTNSLVINYGTTIVTILPNTSRKVVSDSLSWFVVS
jgi:hypothetical protein